MGRSYTLEDIEAEILEHAPLAKLPHDLLDQVTYCASAAAENVRARQRIAELEVELRRSQERNNRALRIARRMRAVGYREGKSEGNREAAAMARERTKSGVYRWMGGDVLAKALEVKAKEAGDGA